MSKQLTDDDDVFDDEDLPADIVNQLRRLQVELNPNEKIRYAKRNRVYRTRRRIEEWSDRRVLRDSVDYLDDELDNVWRTRESAVTNGDGFGRRFPATDE